MLSGAEQPDTEVLGPGADGASPQLPAPAEPSRRRRRRLAAGAAIVLIAIAAAAIVLNSSSSPTKHSSDTGVPPGDTTATVTRRTLTESSTVDGTLGYGSKLEVFDRLSGTFTWLPAVGVETGRGGTLFRIDNMPIVLMFGSVPAYRTMKQGVSEGPDVAELNENLIDLGYDPYGAIGDVEAYDEATAAAVKRWQKVEGLSETGEVELGRIIFAPDARRVTEVHVSLGQDPPGGEASKTPEEGAGEKPKSEKPKSEKPKSEKPKSEKPSGEDPEGKNGEKPSGEGSSGAGQLTLTTTSTQQIVQLKVKAEQQQLARVGEHVPVTLPGGAAVGGRVTSVGTVATESKGSGNEEKGGGQGGEGGEPATIAVTVALERPVAHLDEAPVSVELIKSVRHDVLTVPATALIATAGGGYAIEVLEGVRRAVLAVTPGMFAGGYVQIEGPGLREGMTVLESQ